MSHPTIDAAATPASHWRDHALAATITLALHGGAIALAATAWPNVPPSPTSQVIKTQLLQPPAAPPPEPQPVPRPMPESAAESPPLSPPKEPPALSEAESRVERQRHEKAEVARKRVEEQRAERERHEQAERERQQQARRGEVRREAERQRQERLNEEHQKQERLKQERLERKRQKKMAEQARLDVQRRAQARQAAQEHQAAAAQSSKFDSSQYRPITKRAPDYPSRALHRGIQGDCTVGYRVNAQGRVEDPRIVGDCHPMFVRPSLRAAREFRYEPRIVDGRAVAVPNVKNTFHYRIEH